MPPPALRVLHVEDDEIDRLALERFAKEERLPYDWRVAASISEAKRILEREEIDVVITDYRLPDGTAFDILEMKATIPTIITTGAGNEEVAVRAMKAGAHDYLIKDINRNYFKVLPVTLERVVRHKKSADQIKFISDKASEEAVVIGGAALAETMKTIGLAAESGSPTFITGETGTGKNLVAKAIHFQSPLRAAPFVNINCAALPENLVEAELFGFERGAFTGASQAKKGLLELAEGGTLLLDELGEMPMHLQSKLLGVLDDRRVRRLGGESVRSVDVRVIAATSVNVESALGKTLRSDLFYRLSVIRIALAPLRERRGDIPELCRFFLRKLTGGGPAGGGDVDLPDAEIGRLQAYPWPGNVRELKNILERALILHRGSEIRPSLLLGQHSTREGAAREGAVRDGATREDAAREGAAEMTPPDPPRDMTLADVEREHIEKTFARLGENITQTAKALGISVSTLKRKMRQYEGA